MQEKTSPNLHFLHRTDKLAAKLGCTIKELAEPMGVSWRTIVSGRQEGGPLTRKTWAKLEAAEREAGLIADIQADLERHDVRGGQLSEAARADLIATQLKHLPGVVKSLEDLVKHEKLELAQAHMRRASEILDSLLRPESGPE